jgi:CDP-diacylglycerol--serine O-phosphatidyltransferase
MKLRSIAVLPALVTLGNAVCGMVAIGVLLRAGPLDATAAAAGPQLRALTTAGLLILLAMVFDALDGRVARFARATSDFGGQLDSLCDGVSFGAAPALLAYRVFADAVHSGPLVRLAIVTAAVYMACALVRLARFNVENVHDEEAHMAFRGLPSPAAAGAVASLAILLPEVWARTGPGPLATAIIWSLPVLLLGLGVLMVSTIRYTHVLNQLIRGRRPLSHLIQIVICIALVAFLQEKVLALLFLGYVFSGPAILIYRKAAHAVRSGRSRAKVRGDEESPGR